MAQILVRQLDEVVKEALRRRALRLRAGVTVLLNTNVLGDGIMRLFGAM